MILNAITLFQITYLLANHQFIWLFIRLLTHQKHILWCVFHLDEFHHLGLVAVVLHHQGTDGVGNHHGLTLEEDAVTRDGIQLT